MSLFWRVLVLNGVILVAAVVGVAVAIGPLPWRRELVDVAVVIGALLVMLTADGVLLARLFRPLRRLAQRMETTDVLRGGERPRIEGVAEIATLERTFNDMVGRLERERRDAGFYALQAQEDERRRLARGLHDEVGQSMTAVLLQLKELTAGARPDQRARLAEAQMVVRESLEDIRRLAKELRPEVLDNLGLPSALTHLASTVEQHAHMRVHRRIERNLPALEPQVELVLYRVAQESLTNVVRHAEASEATLALAGNNGNVMLQVSDNGRGFDPTQPEGGGLRGIRERALIVGGAVAIKPGFGGGVEVRLEVPTATE